MTESIVVVESVSETLVLEAIEEVIVVDGGVPGARGPAGPAGPAGVVLVHDQFAPAGSWLIPHTLGHWPDVVVYSLAGERIEPDITVGDTAVTISFATPTAGKAVLL